MYTINRVLIYRRTRRCVLRLEQGTMSRWAEHSTHINAETSETAETADTPATFQYIYRSRYFTGIVILLQFLLRIQCASCADSCYSQVGINAFSHQLSQTEKLGIQAEIGSQAEIGWFRPLQTSPRKSLQSTYRNCCPFGPQVRARHGAEALQREMCSDGILIHRPTKLTRSVERN